MSTLIVVSPGGGSSAAHSIEVCGDQEVTFGRGGAETPVDLTLEDPAVEPVAGRIRASSGYWLLTNLSRVHSYVVENDDVGGEYLRVPPGRLEMPIPFTCARVTMASTRGLLSMTVTAPEPTYVHEPNSRVGADPMAAAFALDETSKYFLVLVALCEPRLCDASSMVIPNTPEIVRRLQRVASCRKITTSAVNFHIRYLARKLQIRAFTDGDPQPRAGWQREAMISRALRFGLTREEHLRLLS
jgi:hypothetical protein